MESGSCYEIYGSKKPSAKIVKVSEGQVNIPQLKDESKVKIVDLGHTLVIQRIPA